MTKHLHHQYMGHTIWRNTEPGQRLRWYTVAPSFSADTLAGIKELIKEHEHDR